MAFAFFRRRQKMVIIIMVVLMVAFLIGFRGFEIIFDRKIEKQSIGETRHGSIRYADIYSAEHDLNILANIGLARPMGQSYSYVPGSIEFQMITSRNNDPARTYAMLVQEAQSAKLIINDDDVNSFLASMDIASTLRDSADWLKAMLQAQRITEDQFRNIVKRWLAVQRLYANNVINLPPSEQIIMVVARDYLEQMKLRILKFDAEDYLEQVDRPITTQQVQETYDKYASTPKGQFSDDNPFGLGYLVPDAVQVSYMFMPQQAYVRGFRPALDDIKKYYDENPQEFTITGEDEEESSVKPFAEVREQIAETLAQDAVMGATDLLTSRMNDLAAGYDPQSEMNVHEWVRSRMIRSADDTLNKRLAVVNIVDQPLHETVDILRRAARIQGIAFPYDDSPNRLDPDVLVTVQGTNITLRDALDQVRNYVQWPQIEWGMIDGVDGVLFPVGGEGAGNFNPIIVAQTDLMNINQVYEHNILANAYAPDRRSDLAMAAFSAEGLANRYDQLPPMMVGSDGQVMLVNGPSNGRILWRLVDARPAHKPQLDDVYDQIVKDLKLIEAYDIAKVESYKIETIENFDSAIESPDARHIETQFFTRSNVMSSGGPIELELNLPPVPQVREEFLDVAWELVPASPDDADEPSTIVPFELPSNRQVIIMQRIDFKPMTKSDFEGRYRDMVYRELSQQSLMASLQWFGANMVQQRLDWQPKLD